MLFIFGCAGSLLLCGLFSSCSLRAAHCSGLSCCGAQALWSSGFSSCDAWAQKLQLLDSRTQAQQLCTGLVTPWHVGTSQPRDQSHVSCIGRWIFSFLPLSHKGNPAIFICYAALGLSCGMQNFQLRYTRSSSYSMWDLELWHGKLLVAACGIQFPHQGWSPGPVHWEHRVIATGPPGKSLVSL